MSEKTNTIKRMLDQAFEDTGAKATRSTAEIATYIAQRSAHLAGGAGQPGFEQAIKDEYSNVKVYSHIQFIDNADASDARLLGLVTGMIAVLAA